MLKAMFLSAVLFGVTTVDFQSSVVATQEAEACGVKLKARAPKLARTQASDNPSKILVVGEKDSALLKQLRTAKHSVTYASSVDQAKGSGYTVVIADSSEMDAARDRYSGANIVKKRSTGLATAKTVEIALARSATSTSTSRTAVASSRRAPVESSQRAPTETGQGTGSPVTPAETSPEVSPSPVKTSVSEKAEREPLVAKVDTTPKAEPRTRVEAPEPVAKPQVERTRKGAKAKAEVDPAESRAKTTWTRLVQFGTNKTNLSAAAQKRLRKNANWLAQNPSATVLIEGHTDSVGDEAYNVDLSERRANVARDFLMGLGIDSSRITVEAKGETEPAFEPSTSGRNRRIVLIKQE
jgi:outer membrane protein OmpA-like peptidoglycan-associated protein